MSNDNNDRLANDLDRMLQGAFETRPRGGGSSPSMVDVRHRARRHQRRRVGSVVGATAMLGVSGVAVLASRGGPESGIAGDEPTSTWSMTVGGTMCGYTPTATDYATTTTGVVGDVSSTVVASTYPSEATSTLVDVAEMSPTTACIPSGQFRCIGNTGMDDQGYTYLEYCEPAAASASNYPATTSFEMVAPTPTLAPLASGQFVVVDASGEGGLAAIDAMQRFGLLVPETEVVIIPSSRTQQRTILIPLGDPAGIAVVSASQLFGIYGFDSWDPSVIVRDLPDEAAVVLVVGRDYWDRFGPVTPLTTTTSTMVPTTTT